MYFITSRQEAVYSKSSYSSDCGSLYFDETKEAFAQLSHEKFRDMKEEGTVRMMLHHAYNDYYFRDGRRQAVSEADQKLFRENALWLIENFIEDDVTKAEFYREAGDLKKAAALIEKVSADDDFKKNLVATIKEKIGKGETEVFLIEEKDRDEKEHTPLSFSDICVACVEILWCILCDAWGSVSRLFFGRRRREQLLQQLQRRMSQLTGTSNSSHLPDDIPEIPEKDDEKERQLYARIERFLQAARAKEQQTDAADDHPPAG